MPGPEPVRRERGPPCPAPAPAAPATSGAALTPRASCASEQIHHKVSPSRGTTARHFQKTFRMASAPGSVSPVYRRGRLMSGAGRRGRLPAPREGLVINRGIRVNPLELPRRPVMSATTVLAILTISCGLGVAAAHATDLSDLADLDRMAAEHQH